MTRLKASELDTHGPRWAGTPTDRARALLDRGAALYSDGHVAGSVYDLLSLFLWGIVAGETVTPASLDGKIPPAWQPSADLVLQLVDAQLAPVIRKRMAATKDVREIVGEQADWLLAVLQVVERVQAQQGHASLVDLALFPDEAERYQVTPDEHAGTDNRSAVSTGRNDAGYKSWWANPMHIDTTCTRCRPGHGSKKGLSPVIAADGRQAVGVGWYNGCGAAHDASAL